MNAIKYTSGVEKNLFYVKIRSYEHFNLDEHLSESLVSAIKQKRDFFVEERSEERRKKLESTKEKNGYAERKKEFEENEIKLRKEDAEAKIPVIRYMGLTLHQIQKETISVGEIFVDPNPEDNVVSYLERRLKIPGTDEIPLVMVAGASMDILTEYGETKIVSMIAKEKYLVAIEREKEKYMRENPLANEDQISRHIMALTDPFSAAFMQMRAIFEDSPPVKSFDIFRVSRALEYVKEGIIELDTLCAVVDDMNEICKYDITKNSKGLILTIYVTYRSLMENRAVLDKYAWIIDQHDKSIVHFNDLDDLGLIFSIRHFVTKTEGKFREISEDEMPKTGTKVIRSVNTDSGFGMAMTDLGPEEKIPPQSIVRCRVACPNCIISFNGPNTRMQLNTSWTCSQFGMGKWQDKPGKLQILNMAKRIDIPNRDCLDPSSLFVLKRIDGKKYLDFETNETSS